MPLLIRCIASIANRVKATMSNHKNSASDPRPDDAEVPTSAPDAHDQSITVPISEFEALQREGAEWKERCVRSQAEFDNVRKRLRKEADEAGTRAVARFVKPLLLEIDNLERALNAAKPEAFNEFAQGITMTHANLLTCLRSAGIEAVPSSGQFDPAIHEVIAESEHPELPRGAIVQVFRPGYRLKDQLVRAAQVAVARGVMPHAKPAAGES
jgi:molecular chaperone GrpE